MDIQQRIDDLTRSYQSIHQALNAYLPKAKPDQDEHLEDLVMLRDTALVLLGSLVELKDSDVIPFEIDLNELSLTVDDFISTAKETVDKTSL